MSEREQDDIIQRYRQALKDDTEEIVDELKDGQISDLQDRIFESADGAWPYTSDQWDIVRYRPGDASKDDVDPGLYEGCEGDIDKMITCIAFGIYEMDLSAAVRDAVEQSIEEIENGIDDLQTEMNVYEQEHPEADDDDEKLIELNTQMEKLTEQKDNLERAVK